MIMDFMFRSASKEALDAYAIEAGLTDDTGNPANCYIDEIGPVMSEPTVIDADGNVTKQAVIDSRHHVNVRLIGGNDPALVAKGNADVEWVNPDTISTPTRIWAGGMNYWRP